MRKKIFHVISITILMLGCSVKNVQSTVMIKQGIGDLSRRSQSIVQGRVAAIAREWNEDKSMIYTTVRVAVERTIKGERAVKEILVRQPGGMIGDKGVKVSGYPSFAQGEEVLLFLEPFETRGPHSGKNKVVGMAQGKFGIDTDAGTGKKTVVPSQEMPILLNAAGKEVTPEGGPIPLDDFIGSILKEISAK